MPVNEDRHGGRPCPVYQDLLTHSSLIPAPLPEILSPVVSASLPNPGPSES